MQCSDRHTAATVMRCPLNTDTWRRHRPGVRTAGAGIRDVAMSEDAHIVVVDDEAEVRDTIGDYLQRTRLSGKSRRVRRGAARHRPRPQSISRRRGS